MDCAACGTASRARGVPLKIKADFEWLPQPLRTSAEPWGKADLEAEGEKEVHKVTAANILYAWVPQWISSLPADLDIV